MKRVKALVMVMIMVTALTGSVPTVEAKTKTSITVTNKATGKKVGKKVTLKTGEKIQLKVKYGKKVVTKKAKYKTSNKKVVTVSKKGKITAKSAGTCTVKVTYKKKTKKIKVTIKAVETKAEESTTEATTETSTEKKMTQQEKVDAYLANEIATHQADPNPSCNHEWEVSRYASDLDNDLTDGNRFVEGWENHLFLSNIWCKKCHTCASTNRIPYLEAKNYTSDELATTILYYSLPLSHSNAPKHKHRCEYGWIPPHGSDYSWLADNYCPICGLMYDSE